VVGTKKLVSYRSAYNGWEQAPVGVDWQTMTRTAFKLALKVWFVDHENQAPEREVCRSPLTTEA
jgi:hypothetical protein